MELGLSQLDPERGLLGPGLELLAYPAEVLLGVAIGAGGLDLIDPVVEVSVESLNILVGGGRAFLRRKLLRGRLPSVFRSAGKTSRVEIGFETEDLFIGGPAFLPFGPHLHRFVALRPPSIVLLRAPKASGRDERADEKQ